MQNRLSLADLKAKANVLANTEFITGGVNDGCHPLETAPAFPNTDNPIKLGKNG